MYNTFKIEIVNYFFFEKIIMNTEILFILCFIVLWLMHRQKTIIKELISTVTCNIVIKTQMNLLKKEKERLRRDMDNYIENMNDLLIIDILQCCNNKVKFNVIKYDVPYEYYNKYTKLKRCNRPTLYVNRKDSVNYYINEPTLEYLCFDEIKSKKVSLFGCFREYNENYPYFDINLIKSYVTNFYNSEIHFIPKDLKILDNCYVNNIYLRDLEQNFLDFDKRYIIP